MPYLGVFRKYMPYLGVFGEKYDGVSNGKGQSQNDKERDDIRQKPRTLSSATSTPSQAPSRRFRHFMCRRTFNVVLWYPKSTICAGGFGSNAGRWRASADLNRCCHGYGVAPGPRRSRLRRLLRVLPLVLQRRFEGGLLTVLFGLRLACGHSCKPFRQHLFEEWSQVWAACDCDSSAYLGNRPCESGPYTVCYVAPVGYVREDPDTQPADNDVARILSAKLGLQNCVYMIRQ
jgi:hypothetical protein